MLFGIFTLLFYVVFIISVIRLIADNREPAKTIAWLLVFFIVPVLGFLVYIVLGTDWRSKRLNNKAKIKRDQLNRTNFMSVIYADNITTDSKLSDWSKSAVALTTANNNTKLLTAETIKIYDNGQDKFDALLADMSQAKQSIHLEYFIWESDELTKKITDVLIDRIKAGVEIRILSVSYTHLTLPTIYSV